MGKIWNFGIGIILFFAMSANASEIEDLNWLTGTWVGEFGPMEIEETWNEPKAGSVQAVVRMRSGEEMIMVEMVVIEEHDNSFRLRFQQWEPGMEPGEYGRQSMRLVESEDQKVAFEAEDEGPLKKLSYQRKSEDELEIAVLTAEDQEHVMLLNSSDSSVKESNSNEDSD